jgi:predicted dehydrogenase
MQVVLSVLGMVADMQATAFRATGGRIKLAGIHTRTIGRMQEFANRQEGDKPRIYTSLAEIADDPVSDLVIVATPPNAREQVVLNCTKGTAARNATTLSIYHRSGKVEEFGEVADTGGGADPMAFTDEWHQAIIRDFADSLGNGTAPFVTGREALHVHAMIYAIQMSAAEGRRVDVDKDIVNV